MTEPNPVVEDDPFGSIKNPKKSAAPPPRDVNGFHARSDVDASKASQHHTLGMSANQAAGGDHIHDGRNGKKIGDGLNLTLTTSVSDAQKILNIIAFLHTVIQFTEN